jgi:hypothetical protein
LSAYRVAIESSLRAPRGDDLTTLANAGSGEMGTLPRSPDLAEELGGTAQRGTAGLHRTHGHSALSIEAVIPRGKCICSNETCENTDNAC